MNLDNLQIPKDIGANLNFRMKLHDWLSKDEGAQKDYIALLKENPVLFYDTMAWTYNPMKPIGEMNCPFIVSNRPAQVEAINTIKKVNWMGDIGIDKSREEGASEIVLKYFTFMLLFMPDVAFIVGSRTENLVDKTGDPTTLFAKIDYTLKYLPLWLSKKLHIERTFSHIRNLDISASIDGEATSENFGAQKRATAVLLDEFGRVEPKIAQSITDSVTDVSKCIIYNSTHWYGKGHAFAKILLRKNISLIKLPWYRNPEKTIGLYHATDKGIWPSDLRSIWFDEEVERRSKRDVMMNIWGYPEGASDQFFDSEVNNTIREKFVRLPDYEGCLSYNDDLKVKFKNDGINFFDIKFKKGVKNSLRWWGKLVDGRPDQSYNYILGCDISFGTGASNSTCMILNRNTGELIGEFVTSEMSPEEFADAVTILAMWIGGAVSPFVIWERTGGQGINFGRRVIENGIVNVYTKTTEATKTRIRQKVFGWDNTGGPNGTKLDLLERLQIALKEGTKDKPNRVFIKIYSDEVIDEIESYIFYPSGELDSSELVDETSGARKRHGDRVIGLGLCVLGMLDMPKSEEQLDKNPPINSLAWRMKQAKLRENSQNRDTWGEPKGKIYGKIWD